MVSVITDVSAYTETQTAPRGAVSNGVAVSLLVAGDIAVIAGSTVLALWARHAVTDEGWVGVVRPIDLIIGVIWLFFLWAMGTYRVRYRVTGLDEYRRVLTAGVSSAAVTGIFAYLVQHDLSRAFFLFLFSIGIPALLTFRLFARRIGQRLRIRGYMSEQVLVAGSPEKIDEIAAVLQRERMLGLQVVGALVPSEDVTMTTVAGIPVVGSIVEATQAASRENASAVIFGEGSFASSADFRRTAWSFESSKTQMMVVPNLTDVSADRLAMRPVAGMPLIHVDEPQAAQAGRWLKRAFDVVSSLGLIILSSPVMLATAIAIKVEDGGPVFFKQTRVGRNGELFGCFKFRSMCPDADKKLAVLQAFNEGNGVLFKMADDPRITKVGKFIRRFSIDEVPQFFNVLRGEMSLVGPRPALPTEVAEYEPDVLRRLAVRPGLTGLWQVSGRSDLSWSETVRLDLYYVDNWSIVQDVAILAKTLGAVVRSRGAY